MSVIFNKDTLQTGDILLFSDKKSFLGKCIQCCTESQYCHAALVLRDPDFTTPPLKGLYVIESTGLEKPADVETHEHYKFGVQVREFDEVVRDHNGGVWVRHVYCKRDNVFNKKLAFAHSVVHNRYYDADPIDWIRALFNIHQGNLHRKNTFFCSALCAYLLASVGVLPNDTSWTIVRPRDLGTEEGPHYNINFLCHVDPEIQIK